MWLCYLGSWLRIGRRIQRQVRNQAKGETHGGEQSQEVNDRGGSFVTVRRICQGLNQLQHESCNCCPSANGRRNQNPASADMG
ncbi:hypothetical protein V6N13_085083 [Hibiscus sabdariffa]